MSRIYLSPHFDDIAFSLGALLLKQPGGLMIDIFTRSAYDATTRSGDAVTAERIERISALRDREDRAFAARVGLRREMLGAEEPSLRGRTSRDAAGVGDDVAQIRVALTAALDRAAAGGAIEIYCPAGIGGHVNHLATRQVVLDWVGQERRNATLLFYEDLPYASNRAVREQAIAGLHAAVGGRSLRRRAWRAPLRKLDLVNLYASQHRRRRMNPFRFSPATPWPFGPHEAVWELQD